MLNATQSLATSALPNAPVEPDLPLRPSRIRTAVRALLDRRDGYRGDREQARRPGDTVVHRAHNADPVTPHHNENHGADRRREPCTADTRRT